MDSLGLAYCGIFYLVFFKEKPNKKKFVTLSTLRPSLSIFQKMPRKYIRKSASNSWAHDQCAGVDSDDDEFVCDICL